MKVANVRMSDAHFFETVQDLDAVPKEDWNLIVDGDKSFVVDILKAASRIRKQSRTSISVCVLNCSLRPLVKVWCSSVFGLGYFEDHFPAVEQAVPQVIPVVETTPAPRPPPDARGLLGPALCINLDRRTDRWTTFTENFDKYNVPYTRFSAVEDTNGALGCAKSHVAVLELQQDLPVAFVVEDDAMITEPIEPLIDEFLRSTADVLMLGWNTRTFKNFSPTFFRVLDAYTTSCYIVKAKVLPDVLSAFRKSVSDLSKKIKNPIDVEWHKLQKRLVFVAPKRHVVIQRESYSDIENRVVNYKV
jgi:glycosyl transferase family 25